MTRTLLASATKEIIMGFDQPFCIIGERINPTGRKQLAEEMKNGNYDTVTADVFEQVAKGAMMLDINAGIPLINEPQMLADTVKLVQSLTDLPLCIDSSIIKALEKGLSAYHGRALLNSVTGEEEQMEQVLPLVKKYDCAVVAISNDEKGISRDPDVRYEVAKKIIERAQDYGIKPCDVVVDPLIMPVGAWGDAGTAALHLIRRLRTELKVNTICGASNVSFGLPSRMHINSAFLSMAIGAGMTSAIMNPCHETEVKAVKGADVIAGNDPDCINWIKNNREISTQRGGHRKGTNRRRKK